MSGVGWNKSVGQIGEMGSRFGVYAGSARVVWAVVVVDDMGPRRKLVLKTCCEEYFCTW